MCGRGRGCVRGESSSSARTRRLRARGWAVGGGRWVDGGQRLGGGSRVQCSAEQCREQCSAGGVTRHRGVEVVVVVRRATSKQASRAEQSRARAREKRARTRQTTETGLVQFSSVRQRRRTRGTGQSPAIPIRLPSAPGCDCTAPPASRRLSTWFRLAEAVYCSSPPAASISTIDTGQLLRWIRVIIALYCSSLLHAPIHAPTIYPSTHSPNHTHYHHHHTITTPHHPSPRRLKRRLASSRLPTYLSQERISEI